MPVSGGTFSAVTTVPETSPCRLRAVPTDIDTNTAYLGAFAGPLFYLSSVRASRSGGAPVGLVAIGAQGDGFIAARDTGGCGVAAITTIEPAGMQVHGSPSGGCAFGLPAGNITASGTPSGSSIKVDGHNAYLPSVVASYLRQSLGLTTLTQSALTLTSRRLNNGDITVTESGPLMRCSAGDTYPPTSTSCPSLVTTGVRFRRVLNLFRGDHQARMRDNFVATDAHQHTVSAQYQAKVGPLPFGAPGYRFPGHGPAFHTAIANQVVTGLGSRAGTVLAESDIHAAPGDPFLDTFAYTWSRAPQKVQFFSAAPLSFALPYQLNVPAHGAAYLGFAHSEHLIVKDTSTLANVAVTEMVNPPTIVSPANGAVVHGRSTTVKGSVTLGANGLPTSVSVSGHAARLTKLSPTTATYAATFNEPFGKHKITVTARNVAGNTKRKSITVTNKP
jgi:hypothetical protein